MVFRGVWPQASLAHKVGSRTHRRPANIADRTLLETDVGNRSALRASLSDKSMHAHRAVAQRSGHILVLVTTILDKTLKREVAIDGEHYTLTISPDSLKLVPKGKRNGVELKWLDLVSGQAALAVALNASLGNLSAVPLREPEPTSTARARPAAKGARPAVKKRK
jgi:hypothetical protein